MIASGGMALLLAIMDAQRSIASPYHYSHPLTYLLIDSYAVVPLPDF